MLVRKQLHLARFSPTCSAPLAEIEPEIRLLGQKTVIKIKNHL